MLLSRKSLLNKLEILRVVLVELTVAVPEVDEQPPQLPVDLALRSTPFGTCIAATLPARAQMKMNENMFGLCLRRDRRDVQVGVVVENRLLVR
jgi:hypothetical protein